MGDKRVDGSSVYKPTRSPVRATKLRGHASVQGDRLPCPMEASEVPETRDGDLSTDLPLTKKFRRKINNDK